MIRPVRIVLLMDAGYLPEKDPDLTGKPDQPIAEYDVARTLRELEYEVSVVGVHDDVQAVVAQLADPRPDLVFNLTEQFNGDRRNDKNLAGLLDLLGIPYTGAGPAGLFLARNKGLCKRLLSARTVRVPGFGVFDGNHKVRMPRGLRFPLVVKPLYEDGSEGISNASLVRTLSELEERVRMIHERFAQPAIGEEYIEGREFYVGIIGNSRLSLLPPRELFFGKSDDGGPVLATYKVKWDPAYQKKWDIKFGFGRIEPDLLKRMERVCKRAYRVMRMRDYGRIDLKVTPEGKIVVFEVNPNPNIAKDDEVAESAKKAGIAYRDLIERIVRMAMRRGEG